MIFGPLEFLVLDLKNLGIGKMTDDSLNDVAFCNTKEGMHFRAKELQLRPYSLGCSCHECNSEFEEVMKGLSVGTQQTADKASAEYDKLFGADNAKLSVGTFDTSDANLGQSKKGYAIPADSVYTKEVWNAAIEAAAQKINYEMGSDEIDTYYIEREIRKLKK